MGIVVKGAVGVISLAGMSHGWTGTEDEYGIRLIPALHPEIEEWIGEHLRGHYVLRAVEDDEIDGPYDPHTHEDQIYFFDVVDYTLFKMRWFGG